MKNIILLILVFFTVHIGTSQTARLKEGCYPVYKFYTEKDELSKIEERYKNLTNPNPDSWLSKHLREKLDGKYINELKKIPLIVKKRKKKREDKRMLLNTITVPLYSNSEKPSRSVKSDVVGLISNSRLIKLPETIIRNDVIFLSFVVNNDNIISSVDISTGISDLNSELREIFREIPIEKLGLNNKSKAKIYKVQLFEYKEGIPFINASKLAIESKEDTLWDNPNLITRQSPEVYKTYNEIEKSLFQKKSNVQNNNYLANLLKKELDTVDLRKLEELRLVSSYNLGFLLNKSEKPFYKDYNKNLYSKFPYLFKNNVLKLSFSVNRKNKITNTFVYTGDRNLDLGIVKMFESIPLEKLGLQGENNQGDYEMQLLEYKDDVVFINTSSIAIEPIKLQLLNYSEEEYNKKTLNRKEVYKKLSKPSEESPLAKFLRKKIDDEYLEKLKNNRLVTNNVTDSTNNKSILLTRNDAFIISFYINKKGKIRVNSNKQRNYDLNKEIIDIFKQVPLQKLGLPKGSKKGSYSVQLFEYVNDVPYINASSIALKEKEPILKSCNHLDKKYKKLDCAILTIRDHVANNISATTLTNQKDRGIININIRYKVNSIGKMIDIKSYTSNEIIEEEVDKALKSFSQMFTPATMNGEPVESYEQKIYFNIQIEDK